LRRHVKNLTLLLYYELEHFDSAESLVVSYRQYIKRTSGFKGMYGPWYENFLKFYSELLDLKLNNTHSSNHLQLQDRQLHDPQLQDLQIRIDKTVKTLFKEWLLQKIQNLIQQAV
jgi:hypothetical protein